MITVLPDTCVWLDIVKDYRQRPTLIALEELAGNGDIRLAIPRQVAVEFERNKDRVAAESAKSLSGVIKRVKGAIEQYGDPATKPLALSELSDIDQRLVIDGEAANEAVAAVEKLFACGELIETSDDALAKAGRRGLERRAPFHGTKNSMGDAVLIETYASLLKRGNDDERFAFVTHNKHDFSHMGVDERHPHPDLASLFDGARSTYHLSLGALLHDINPEALAEATWQYEYEEEPRKLSEISDAAYLLYRQVWYNRHWNLRHKIEHGTVRLVSASELSRNPYSPDECLDTVWERALAAAKQTEDEVGLDNLGPWDDFEWGMLNGKLSALRWVMGAEWDFLDT